MLLHEFAHWTGHKKRLNRDIDHPRGTDGHAKEELRACLASLFLADRTGVSYYPRARSVHMDYWSAWVRIIRQDPLEIFRAAADAEKICDYLVPPSLWEYALEQQRELEEERERLSMEATVPSVERITSAILESLCKQGYIVQDGLIRLPENPSKDNFRNLNRLAIQRKREASARGNPGTVRTIIYLRISLRR